MPNWTEYVTVTIDTVVEAGLIFFKVPVICKPTNEDGKKEMK